MTHQDSKKAYQIFLIMAAVFITSLVVSNLIFQKFVTVNFFGIYTFEISVGILPYPLTFLITDIISEVYGKKMAQNVVTAGIFASLFSLIFVYAGSLTNATEWSPIDNALYAKVFGATSIAVFASMMAYLAAQYIDIQIFHFWKRVTKGEMLWVRNNFSTITSQFIDTSTVLLLLCSFGKIEWSRFDELLLSGFLFKVLMALIDTPFFYVCVHLFNKRFKLKRGDELNFNIT